MTKRKFSPNDWVTIKYGEYAGRYGKISMLEKNGDYVVLPYNENDEPGPMITMNARSMTKIEPLLFSRRQLMALVSGELFYSAFEDRVFPPYNVKAEEPYSLQVQDIKAALININQNKNALALFKEWFWLILNVFYDDLNIEPRVMEDFFSDAPETDDENFSVIFTMVEKLYWRLEERFVQKEDIEKYIIKFKDAQNWEQKNRFRPIEESAYRAVCEDIISRIEMYQRNKYLPRRLWSYSDSQKKHIISGYENNDSLNGATPEALELYVSFVEDLYHKGDPQAMAILGWGHYEGNAAFDQNWELSEKYLRELFEKTGDPSAANSLGYIYYYGRVNGGTPEYEKAFKYFSFGALSGIDESIYKTGDMLIRGEGTVKNLDMGLTMIVDGYRDSMDRFCRGEYDNKLADYALRMGNACRDQLIYGMNLRDAYKFYLEAQFAIRKRREINEDYGDDHVEARIERQIALIREQMNLDFQSAELRVDFPIYINMLFEDKYPIRVELDVPAGSDKGMLTFSRYRFGSELVAGAAVTEGSDTFRLLTPPQILVSYPELSYAELTSKLTFRLEGVVVAKKTHPGPYFLCDGFRRNDNTNALELYAGGELAAAIETEWYVVKVDK